jgi:K+/H+ antiporter YhaU regulatory subunit KhtT
VFADLLDFDGDEIYFTSAREVAGQTYAAAQLGYEASSVIGIVDAAGAVHMNPPADTVLAAEDNLILVASDDSAVKYTGARVVDTLAPLPAGQPTQGPIRLLIVGWSTFGGLVLQQLDEFLVSGSSIVVSVDADLADAASIPTRLVNGTVSIEPGRGGPEDIFALEGRDFDQVIVLGYRDALSPADADARTLLSLLALRMMWPRDTDDHVRIVAELVDQRNLAIATPVGIDDLIVSDALASLMMAQLSEHAALLAVFEDLFDPDGAVISLLPAPSLVPSSAVEYATVVAAASAQGASAFGIRRSDGEVVMNPAKSSRVTLGAGDQVIAVAARASSAPPPAPVSKRTQRASGSTAKRK